MCALDLMIMNFLGTKWTPFHGVAMFLVFIIHLLMELPRVFIRLCWFQGLTLGLRKRYANMPLKGFMFFACVSPYFLALVALLAFFKLLNYRSSA